VVLARLNRLRKVYGGHVAVHDLSLHLCMDEVTALLGHNGAGAMLQSLMTSFCHDFICVGSDKAFG
jgi:ABC-type sugar transport system ATPase subunit